MNGAQILLQTAMEQGIEICFGNPGTTELPIVSAFDEVMGIRPILGLFEGVCTGAADGYGRMRGVPAMTLLHLGPGLANGIANLHNAKRARTPIVNVIGDHATWHRSVDPPLSMNIPSLAETVSGWFRNVESIETLAGYVARAVRAAQKGQVATLVIPHDILIADFDGPSGIHASPIGPSNDDDKLEDALDLLRHHPPVALVLGGTLLHAQGLHTAARIKAATGCDLLMETFPSRMERGAGLPMVRRIPYYPEPAGELLSRYASVILAGAREPVAFFGYPGTASRLLSENQRVVNLGTDLLQAEHTLNQIADMVKTNMDRSALSASMGAYQRPQIPNGKLTPAKIGATVAAIQPEAAIIVDEAVTSGLAWYLQSETTAPHTYLSLTGGALGQGMPCACGAAVACPGRQIINLQADGSAMYTVQALWTQAREGLNVTTLIYSNRRYRILQKELARAGNANPGPYAWGQIDLGNPNLNWSAIANGMGVPAVSVETVKDLADQFRNALDEPGPHLIEMILEEN